jgi:5'-methylthioadenosine phosphorylase
MNTSMQTCATPFGSIDLRVLEGSEQRIALLQDERSPRAALYAAKTLGITRVIELISAVGLDRLIGSPAIVAPHDLVDLTVGRAATFFVGKGYGFLSQQHVFCPELRRAALPALEASGPRAFARGTLAVTEDLAGPIDPRWNAQLMARHGAPTAYLAKELEICYLPLCQVGQPVDRTSLLDRLLTHLPGTRACPCATAMQPTRERGLIGDDWRTWL